MKKLLIIFVLLTTICSTQSQITPKWNLFNGDLERTIDSVTDENNYKLNNFKFYQYYNLVGIVKYRNVEFSDPISVLDSNNIARLVFEEIRNFPKTGKFYNQGENVSGYFHIEIFNFNENKWTRAFSFSEKNHSQIDFENINIGNLQIHSIGYVNKSTIFVEGFFDEIDGSTSPFIGKLVKDNINLVWKFEITKIWRRTGSSVLSLKMLNENIGYAIFTNMEIKTKMVNEILYTKNGWKNYNVIFSSSKDPNKGFSTPRYTNLSVNPHINDTLVSFVYPEEEMLYYSKDNFQKLQMVDFSLNCRPLDVQVVGKDVIYVLTHGEVPVKDKSWNISCQKLLKSTNYGNTWKEIYCSKIGDTINSFKAFDEDVFILEGCFINHELIKHNIIYTKDGGKTIEFLFEPLIGETDFLVDYEFLKREQIAICKRNDIFRIRNIAPYYDTNLTYSHQMDVFHNELNDSYSYALSSKEFTLQPPIAKFDEEKPKVFHFDTDTLFWNKVEGATKYSISLYGFSNASVIFFKPDLKRAFNFSFKPLKRIDTTVTDTFLIINDLKRNYDFLIWITSENQSQKSEPYFIRTFSYDEIKMNTPIILYPEHRDTIPSGNVNLIWTDIEGAEYYNITLYLCDIVHCNVYDFNRVHYLVNKRYYKGTSFLYGDLLPNSIYMFSVTAENGDEITQVGSCFFYTDEINSVHLFQENISLAAFPNPVETSARILIGTMENPIFSVYDIFGNQINLEYNYEKNIDKEYLRFNTELLPQGVYFYKIQNGINYYQGKFIKK